ncbi:N-6 DNA methylase [Phytohabitans suffuscus]
MSRADVARAAGVSDQAVSNWARRHPGFPRVVRHGSRAGYPVAAVAAWLDGRRVPASDLRLGERPGLTYGKRFRTAAGLAVPLGAGKPADRQPADQVDERLWTAVERLLRNSDKPEVFEAVVLSLLCLRDRDPAGWAAMSRASAETIHEAVMQVWQGLPQHLAMATAVLRDVPSTTWWRHRLLQLVGVLSADRTPPADAFTYLLDRFAKHRHSSSDEYLIPTKLAQLMVRILNPHPGNRVHDPSCGLGNLLVAAGEHAAAAGNGSLATITGRASTVRTWSFSTMNIAIHGMKADIGDGPPADHTEVDAIPGQFDIVLLNPPFGMKTWSLPASRPSRPWRYGEPSPHNATFAWLQTAAEALAPGGRAAVVMPYTAVFAQTTRERKIRGAMIEHGVVRCVIALPSHLFRETTVPVTVWILAHAGDEAGRNVLLIDARAAARKDGPTHRVLTELDCRTVIDAYHGWLDGSAVFPIVIDNITATTATVVEIRENDYDLQPVTYLDQHRHVATDQRSRALLHALPNDLVRLDAAARAADLALDRCLEGLALWTP